MNGLVDGLVVGEVFPIGQHVGGDEVDRRGELRIVAPDVPDFTGRDGNRDLALYPADIFDEVLELEFIAIQRFVADHDADDVRVACFASSTAEAISRSLRSAFLSIQAPTVTLRPNSLAMAGTISTPPVDE